MLHENDSSAEVQARARLHELARRRAHELRDAAVDDFWRGADAWLHASLQNAQTLAARSASRFQARLARHRLLRQGAGS